MKTITGKFVGPNNAAVANGILKLRLSQATNISATAQVAPLEVTITLDANGNIPGSTQIYANDEMTPSGTTYYATLSTGVADASGTYQPGGQIWQQQWSIVGSSPIDLTTLVPATSGVSTVTPITSVGLIVPGELTVTGSPLVANGSITIGKANENANKVWAGPTSGGDAAPTFRNLVEADITVPVLTKLTGSGGQLTLPAGPSTIVGRSTTDTFQNKTLQAASSGNAVTLLNIQAAKSAIVGNSAPQNLYTYTLPANVLGINKALRIRFGFSHSTGTASIAYFLNFGGTAVGSVASATTSFAGGEAMIWNNGATNVQQAFNFPMGGALAGWLGNGAAAIDTTASVVINLTFNVANTDQVTPMIFVVELIQ